MEYAINTMKDVGADYIIYDISQLPNVIQHINRRMNVNNKI